MNARQRSVQPALSTTNPISLNMFCTWASTAKKAAKAGKLQSVVTRRNIGGVRKSNQNDPRDAIS